MACLFNWGCGERCDSYRYPSPTTLHCCGSFYCHPSSPAICDGSGQAARMCRCGGREGGDTPGMPAPLMVAPRTGFNPATARPYVTPLARQRARLHVPSTTRGRRRWRHGPAPFPVGTEPQLRHTAGRRYRHRRRGVCHLPRAPAADRRLRAKKRGTDEPTLVYKVGSTVPSTYGSRAIPSDKAGRDAALRPGAACSSVGIVRGAADLELPREVFVRPCPASRHPAGPRAVTRSAPPAGPARPPCGGFPDREMRWRTCAAVRLRQAPPPSFCVVDPALLI